MGKKEREEAWKAFQAVSAELEQAEESYARARRDMARHADAVAKHEERWHLAKSALTKALERGEGDAADDC
ncbi:MAG: hypothetical protein V3V34_11885 [Kiloniellales bacterium]